MSEGGPFARLARTAPRKSTRLFTRNLSDSRPAYYGHSVTKTPPTARLAEFELLVMVAAMRLGADEAHAVSIAADITERTGRGVRRANVYMTLQRLEEKGLLTTAPWRPAPRTWRETPPAGDANA